MTRLNPEIEKLIEESVSYLEDFYDEDTVGDMRGRMRAGFRLGVEKAAEIIKSHEVGGHGFYTGVVDDALNAVFDRVRALASEQADAGAGDGKNG